MKSNTSINHENSNDANRLLAVVNIYTVGSLKRALKGLPDDRIIVCQVEANDGKVWNMRGEFCPQVPQGTIACLIFTHKKLETLP